MNRIYKIFTTFVIAVLLLPNQGIQTVLGAPNIPEVDYTDQLIEITDFGIFDSAGYRIDNLDIFNDDIELYQIPEQSASTQKNLFDSVFEEYKNSLISNWGGKRKFTERRLEGIKANLSNELKHFYDIDESLASTREKISPLQNKILSLKEQIDVYNQQIKQTRNKITEMEIRIAQKQIDIAEMMKKIQRSQIELKAQRDVILNYLSLMYKEEERYLDVYATGSSTVKLLLADASISETLMGQQYLRVMEDTGRTLFYNLQKNNNKLVEQQNQLMADEFVLKKMRFSLNSEKELLKEGRIARQDLLDKTQGDEQRYLALVDESIQAQAQSAVAIQNLRDNVSFIEEKLSLLDEGLYDAEGELMDLKTEAKQTGNLSAVVKAANLAGVDVEKKAIRSVLPETNSELRWPVPARAITTYFHDPTYPKKWGIHNALDLRAPMFTPILAPADGYVVEVKDGGMGYSYIILAHKNNLMTVYGHVYEIQAQPGTVVKAGEQIGLTGGKPGVKGAGLRTTGPHLHFETYYKGEPTDPLNFLPVAELPIEYIPDRFLNQVGGKE